MANTVEQLLEDVESLKNILVSSATGGVVAAADYSLLRRRLMQNHLLRDKLPRFVRTCRNLDEFWPFIKEQDGTYAGRRRFLAEAFDTILTFLEHQPEHPVTSRSARSWTRLMLPTSPQHGKRLWSDERPIPAGQLRLPEHWSKRSANTSWMNREWTTTSPTICPNFTGRLLPR